MAAWFFACTAESGLVNRLSTVLLNVPLNASPAPYVMLLTMTMKNMQGITHVEPSGCSF